MSSIRCDLQEFSWGLNAWLELNEDRCLAGKPAFREANIAIVFLLMIKEDTAQSCEWESVLSELIKIGLLLAGFLFWWPLS